MKHPMPRLSHVLLLTTFTLALGGTPASAQLAGMTTLEPEVIDPGQQPRQELRYRFTEGQTSTMGMDMAMVMSNVMDGSPLVDIQMQISSRIETTVTEVYEDGSARFELVFTRYDVEGLGDELAQGELDAVTDGLEGVSMWQVVDTRGNTLDFGLDPGVALPPELEAQILDTTVAAQPLPEEPVGVGARWVAAGTMDAEGMPMQMTVETELLELDEDGAVMAMVIDADAADPSAMMSAMPAGVELTVAGMTMSGGGQAEVAFDDLVPHSEAELDLALDLSISATEAGETYDFDLQFGMLLGMEVYSVE